MLSGKTNIIWHDSNTFRLRQRWVVTIIAESTIHANAFAVTSAASGAVTQTVRGTWSICDGVPTLVELGRALRRPTEPPSLIVEAVELRHWDSALLSFLFAAIMLCRENGVVAELGSLSDNVQGLIDLATAAPIHVDAPRTTFCHELSGGTRGRASGGQLLTGAVAHRNLNLC